MARLPEVVADASIVCKWYVHESDSDIAVSLRDAHSKGQVRILAPQLLPYEIANVLRFRPGISPNDLRGIMRSFFDLQLALAPPTSASLRHALDFAFREKLTIYDACYAVLAESHACPLVTADTDLLRASNLAVRVSDWSNDS
jgi:predicted nucleic acid-binding protein